MAPYNADALYSAFTMVALKRKLRASLGFNDRVIHTIPGTWCFFLVPYSMGIFPTASQSPGFSVCISLTLNLLR